MDETSLRKLLDSALAHEPPIGPVAQKSLRAGIRLRRRRLALSATARALAAVAVIAVVIPAVNGDTQPHLQRPADARQHEVVVYIDQRSHITYADLRGHQHPGTAHPDLARGPRRLAITPNGKTLYVPARTPMTHRDTYQHRHQQSRTSPSRSARAPSASRSLPDGQTVYVANIISNT